MTTTVEYGAVTLTPQVVDGWQQSRPSRVREHELIGGGSEFTRTRPGPRRGTLTLVFASEEDAAAADLLHTTAPYVDLASDDRDLVNMRYIVTGDINVDLDPETRDVWVVTVGYTEVEQ